MKLTELEPMFQRYEERMEQKEFVVGNLATWKPGDPTERRIAPTFYYIPVATLAEADGIRFVCPLCFKNLGGRAGAHLVRVGFAGRSYSDQAAVHNKAGQAVRWEVSGSGFDDLTITPSIQIDDGCGWHGHVIDGEVT
jgi:hypothetical protein